jgi:hypothetical protein
MRRRKLFELLLLRARQFLHALTLAVVIYRILLNALLVHHGALRFLRVHQRRIERQALIDTRQGQRATRRSLIETPVFYRLRYPPFLGILQTNSTARYIAV